MTMKKLENPRPDMARSQIALEGLEDRYWCVHTNQSRNGFVYFQADRVEVTDSGTLIGWSHEGRIRVSSAHIPGYEDEEECNERYEEVFYPVPTICFAAGSWTSFWAAKSKNGACIGATRWDGVFIEEGQEE